MTSRGSRTKRMREMVEKIICILAGAFLLWIAYVSYKIGMVR